MRKWIRNIIMTVMTVMMAAAPVRVAAEYVTVLSIPVTWQANDLLSEQKYTVTLSAVTPDAPMPQGSVDGVDVVSLEDTSSLDLQIQYGAPAEYWYTLTAERKDGKQIASYALHVMVVNGSNGSLEANMTVRQGSKEGVKTDRIVLLLHQVQRHLQHLSLPPAQHHPFPRRLQLLPLRFHPVLLLPPLQLLLY